MYTILMFINVIIIYNDTNIINDRFKLTKMLKNVKLEEKKSMGIHAGNRTQELLITCRMLFLWTTPPRCIFHIQTHIFTISNAPWFNNIFLLQRKFSKHGLTNLNLIYKMYTALNLQHKSTNFRFNTIIKLN